MSSSADTVVPNFEGMEEAAEVSADKVKSGVKPQEARRGWIKMSKWQ
jgi:hypothetical protein